MKFILKLLIYRFDFSRLESVYSGDYLWDKLISLGELIPKTIPVMLLKKKIGKPLIPFKYSPLYYPILH
jgi:hypothetical protein